MLSGSKSKEMDNASLTCMAFNPPQAPSIVGCNSLMPLLLLNVFPFCCAVHHLQWHAELLKCNSAETRLSWQMWLRVNQTTVSLNQLLLWNHHRLQQLFVIIITLVHCRGLHTRTLVYCTQLIYTRGLMVWEENPKRLTGEFSLTPRVIDRDCEIWVR